MLVNAFNECHFKGKISKYYSGNVVAIVDEIKIMANTDLIFFFFSNKIKNLYGTQRTFLYPALQ